MGRAICILGMHRSGTSLAAELLECLGVYFGRQEDLLPANYANPRGYWELRAIAETHDLLLRELSREWDTAFPLPEGWHRRPEIQPYRDRLEEVVRTAFADHDTFGWKDPRTCLTLPLWKDLLEGLGIPVHYVLVFRNPLDVASSLVQRDGFDAGDAAGLWFHYNLQILTQTADQVRTSLRYEDLLNRGGTQLNRLAEALSLEALGDAVPGEDVIDPDLCHSRSTPEAVSSRAPALVGELYDLILAASADQLGREELDRRARESFRALRRYSEVLHHDRREAIKRIERLARELEEERQQRLTLQDRADRASRELEDSLERQRRLAADLAGAETQLENSLEHQRRLAADLATIHESRWWRLADRYWSFRRRLGLTR